jgi:hypothetical protein
MVMVQSGYTARGTAPTRRELGRGIESIAPSTLYMEWPEQDANNGPTVGKPVVSVPIHHIQSHITHNSTSTGGWVSIHPTPTLPNVTAPRTVVPRYLSTLSVLPFQPGPVRFFHIFGFGRERASEWAGGVTVTVSVSVSLLVVQIRHRLAVSPRLPSSKRHSESAWAQAKLACCAGGDWGMGDHPRISHLAYLVYFLTRIFFREWRGCL